MLISVERCLLIICCCEGKTRYGKSAYGNSSIASVELLSLVVGLAKLEIIPPSEIPYNVQNSLGEENEDGKRVKTSLKNDHGCSVTL